MSSSELQLRCLICSHAEVVNPDGMLRRLQSVGKLRREKEPDSALLAELLRAAAGQLVCAGCGHVGLNVEQPVEEDWGPLRTCESCGQPIAAERLEVFPATTRCTACQVADDVGESSDEREFCPKCGAVMVLKRAASGYAWACSECRGGRSGDRSRVWH